MKKNKKILTLLGVAALFIAFAPIIINASNNINSEKSDILKYKSFVTELTKKRPNKIQITKMCDLENNLFYLIKTDEKGLFVFNKDDVCLEYMPDKTLDLKDEKVFYLGHLQYFIKTENGFKNILNSEEIDDKTALIYQKNLNNFNKALKEQNKNNSLSLNSAIKVNNSTKLFSSYNNNFSSSSWIGDERYIKGYEYLLNPKYPRNTEDTCGYISAVLVLWWWHKMKNDTIIPQKFLDSNGELLTSGYTLQDELLSIAKDIGIGYSTWAKDLTDIIVGFAKKHGLGVSTWWFLLNYKIWEEIDNGYPVIAFGSIPGWISKDNITNDSSFSNGGLDTFHSVVIYGYNSKYYICNFGWNNNEKVYLVNILWGSNTQVRFHE